MMNRCAKTSGVTLIELLIAIAVLGLVIMLALPSYTTWIQNTQIRNAVESLANGIKLARAEAVRRNVNVNVIVGPGANWDVRVVNPDVQIQSYASEGAASAAVNTGGLTRITFNGLGRVVNPNPIGGSAPITQIDVDSSVNPADSRELRITIGAGGNVRTCDPIVTDPNDIRKCP